MKKVESAEPWIVAGEREGAVCEVVRVDESRKSAISTVVVSDLYLVGRSGEVVCE
jgi:hypothetical protein